MSDWENEKKVILRKVKGLVDMIALPTETWLAKSTDLKFLKNFQRNTFSTKHHLCQW